LLDQGVPRRAAALLQEAGVDALHVAELGMSSADDAEILAWCRHNAAVAVTLDADFHASIALSGGTGPSAIRLRVEGFGDRVIQATIPDGPRNQLVGGTWDSTAVLLEAGDAIEATAKRLPYVKGY
jgi:predicted nuclease of predicted toxin-antitoxin system